MRQHPIFCLFLLTMLANSCSVKKSIGFYGKLQTLQSDVRATGSDGEKLQMSDLKLAEAWLTKTTARIRQQPWHKNLIHAGKTLTQSLPKGGTHPLKGKTRKSTADEPDPRTTEKLGIIGCAAGVIGVVGLFATNFLPVIFAAAVIAILGGLVGVMRSKGKYKRQGFAKVSLVLGLITLIGLAIML